MLSRFHSVCVCVGACVWCEIKVPTFYSIGNKEFCLQDAMWPLRVTSGVEPYSGPRSAPREQKADLHLWCQGPSAISPPARKTTNPSERTPPAFMSRIFWFLREKHFLWRLIPVVLNAPRSDLERVCLVEDRIWIYCQVGYKEFALFVHKHVFKNRIEI